MIIISIYLYIYIYINIYIIEGKKIKCIKKKKTKTARIG